MYGRHLDKILEHNIDFWSLVRLKTSRQTGDSLVWLCYFEMHFNHLGGTFASVYFWMKYFLFYSNLIKVRFRRLKLSLFQIVTYQFLGARPLPEPFYDQCVPFNTLRPRQNGRHFADEIFRCIFVIENAWISVKISLKFFLMVQSKVFQHWFK